MFKALSAECLSQKKLCVVHLVLAKEGDEEGSIFPGCLGEMNNRGGLLPEDHLLGFEIIVPAGDLIMKSLLIPDNRGIILE